MKLVEKLAKIIEKHGKKAVFVVEFSNKAKKVKILDFDGDFIEIVDEGGNVSLIPLTGGLSEIRDVTDSPTHEWKGKEDVTPEKGSDEVSEPKTGKKGRKTDKKEGSA